MEDKSPSGVTKRNDGGKKQTEKKTKQQQRSGRCLQTRLNESPSTHNKREQATTATRRRRGRPGGRLLCMFAKWPDKSFSEKKEESN